MPSRRVITGRSQEPRRRFAEELRLLRAERGESLRQLAETLGWDASLFGKLESGATLGGPEVAQALDQHYGTPGLLLALWELAVGDPAQFKERYRRYMVLEAEAVSLWHYAAAALPGVLQTSEYARELLAAGGLDGDALEVQVEARVGRRAVLLADGAPRFRTILSEAVLRTPLADAAKWREQLEHLLLMVQRNNVTVHVMPLSAGLHGLTNTDAMFLRNADGRTVAWVETGYSGELVQETADVERLQLRYDLVRDLALSPDESRKFIRRMLEEVSCEPST
ncbi:helix-turn-helix domain-containing protein [Streptomyces sp. WI04-05B]|uniref:helix-turn-helix domain-containing protein n=1 Tax=Streptomyces TaxID=1883 RepID=UPI0029BD6669|nr:MULTISPECIES: helix-turn-helix transcriptional regulator [unclassified Streptomyces]MDX2544855.1 helix-turn-helix transcriptional regulator [Streptomyces sp. WI04-05B]MDX2588903.1 helix-turn-helix transcriptional regulator [Streptomyces sp. WI04-05A]